MSRNRQYTRKELESLRRADLQNLYKIHGLKGANQKSDALIDTLVVHFTSAAYTNAPELPTGTESRRLKTIDLQALGRSSKDVPKRPTPVASGSRPVKPPGRAVSRSIPVTVPEAEPVLSIVPSSASIDWESRLQQMEEVWTERLRLAELAFQEQLRVVEEKWEARWLSLQPTPLVHPSPPASTPRVVITDPSPLKRPLPEESLTAPGSCHGPPARKRIRSETDSEMTTPPQVEENVPIDEAICTPSDRVADPRTPSPAHQGVPDDMSRTPGVGDIITGLPYPVFATTPKPGEPRSPTLDAPPSASRQRAWSSNSMPKMLTPGRKRREAAPRAVSQAHMDLTTITESDEAPILRRCQTPPLYPPARSRDRTTTPPRLSPSPSITERAFQHPQYPSRGSSLVPQGPRSRQSSAPAREYMDVALHGLPMQADSPSALATPGHRTILGTERYRDTRFGDVPVLNWGSPSVDFGTTPQRPLGR